MVCLHRVRTPLSAYVDYLWVAEGYVQVHARELVLPTGSMTLVVDLDAPTSDAAAICGARSRPLVLDTSKPLRRMAAHFTPGGGFAFARCPAGELENLQVPLAAFWPTEAPELCERIFEARTNPERFRLLEVFLMRRLRGAPSSSAAVRRAIRQFQDPHAACSVRSVTAQVGMSAQRFIEVFRGEVGVPPKVFARLARFRRAVDRIDMAPDVDWADLAAATGYFDQSHLIRDFRQFAGLTPAAYVRQRTSQNHVRVAD